MFGCIFSEKVSIEIFHISSESQHKKQQVSMKNICTEERGESYDIKKYVFKFR